MKMACWEGRLLAACLGLEGLRLGSLRQGLEQGVDFALHDPVQRVEGQVDAVVRAAALREVVGADAL